MLKDEDQGDLHQTEGYSEGAKAIALQSYIVLARFRRCWEETRVKIRLQHESFVGNAY